MEHEVLEQSVHEIGAPSPDSDLLLDWSADELLPDNSRQRRVRTALALCLLISVSIHVVAIGAVLVVWHDRTSPPRFRIAGAEGAQMGGMSSLGSKGEVHPFDSLSRFSPRSQLQPDNPVHALANDESDVVPLDAHAQSAAMALGETSTDPFAAPRQSAVPQTPFAMPAIPSAAPDLPNTASKNDRKAVMQSPQIAGANGSQAGNHNAKNGYDNRGLPIPDYPAESRRRHEQGLIQLDVEVKPDGQVGAIIILEDAGFPRLAQAAIAAVREGTFIPATVDGIPTTGHIQIPFRFVP